MSYKHSAKANYNSTFGETPMLRIYLCVFLLCYSDTINICEKFNLCWTAIAITIKRNVIYNTPVWTSQETLSTSTPWALRSGAPPKYRFLLGLIRRYHISHSLILRNSCGEFDAIACRMSEGAGVWGLIWPTVYYINGWNQFWDNKVPRQDKYRTISNSNTSKSEPGSLGLMPDFKTQKQIKHIPKSN